MTISDILSGAAVREYHVSPALLVKDVVNDSKKAEKGTVFAAMKGEREDGAEYIKEAVMRGCEAVLCEKAPDTDCPYILTDDCRASYAFACAALRGDPQKKLRMAAVTGTNGKTTTAAMLYHIITHIRGKGSCALTGTVCDRIGEETIPSHQTTPDPSVLYSRLSDAVSYGSGFAVIEASSHALEYKKLAPCRFEAGAITNLTEDHLDSHKTMQAYFESKKRLIPLCDKFISNGDDVYTKTLDCPHFSLHGGQFTARINELSDDSICFDYYGSKTARCAVPVCGKFNVYNALTALALSELLGFDAVSAAQALGDFKGVAGRFSKYALKNGATAIIDYAHTPDALENALAAARGICRGKLFCVFGCGGDRDKNKRHLMGAVSSRLADVTIVTEDNSRSEDPDEIISQIMKGVDRSCRYRVIKDRKDAILYAFDSAARGDVILLAGKGHEDYEINRLGSRPFSEASIIKDFNDGGIGYEYNDSCGSGEDV